MRTNSRAAKLSAVGLSLALFLAACGSDSKDDNGANDTTADTTETTEGTGTTGDTGGSEENGGRKEGDGELVIGAVLPQTGNLAQLGPPMINGVEMAVHDINEAGGINGKDVRLIVKDDGGGGNDDLATTSVDELINNEDVDAIIGAAASGTTKSIIDRITSAGVVQCSPSNTGSDLSDWPDKGLYFRTAPADNLQAQALAKAISDDGKQNVAIIAQNSDYGTGFVEYLEPALTDAGAEIVENVAYDLTGTSFDAEAERAVGASPDAIALIAYPEDGGKVLKALDEKGVDFTETTIYVTDGLQSNTLYEEVDADRPEITNGIKGTAASAAPESGAPWFPEAFADFAPDVESPIYSAQAYDCVMAIALAAAKAESDAPFDIAENIVPVTKGTADDAEKCNTAEDCLALIADGKEIDYDGASGALDFSDRGEPSAGAYDVYEFGDDGTYENFDQVVVGD